MLKTNDTWKDGYELLPRKISFNDKKIQFTPIEDSTSLLKSLTPLELNNREDKSYRYTARSASEVKAFAINSLTSLGYGNFATCDQLADLAETLFARFKTNYLKCRMDLVYTDSCRKFHIDSLYVRAITTLLGPGTEYKLNSKSNEIHQVETGETILLKGLRSSGKKPKVLHRSPPISKLGIKRLVFVMDY